MPETAVRTFPFWSITGDTVPTDRGYSLKILGNFDRLWQAKAAAQENNGFVEGYLNGLHRRGWVAYVKEMELCLKQ